MKKIMKKICETTKINKPTVYLAGPIMGLSKKEANVWRKKVIEKLSHKYNLINPLDVELKCSTISEIVELDKKNIMLSDYVIVDATQPSVGTAMETIFSWEQHKEVLMFSETGKVDSIWYKYHASIIFASLDQLIDHLL